MATTRYFKATDGERTFFRATPTRVYVSMTRYDDYRFYSFHNDGRGRFPAVEITRKEYVALTALKVARCEAEKAAWVAANPNETVSPWAFRGTAPSDSWVYNRDVVI